MEGPHARAPNVFARLMTDKAVPAYKVDEGYSEETRSQEDMETSARMFGDNGPSLAGRMPLGSSLHDAVLALSETERREFAYNILRSLRVSSIATVVDQLWPLFHKDPVEHFPPEIMSLIFSYLEPSMLIEASRASRAWRARILDSRLWKEKFRTEGWTLDTQEVDEFERQCNAPKVSKATFARRRSERKEGARPHGLDSLRPRTSKEQDKHPSLFIGHSRKGSYSASLRDLERLPSRNHLNEIEGSQSRSNISNGPSISTSLMGNVDEEMLDASESSSEPETNVSDVDAGTSSPELKDGNDNVHEDALPENLGQPESLVAQPVPGQYRLNYHYVFAQKRKLEENWNAGRYKSFQLPHRDHPEDAHTECVYTIQYLGKHLVSGSRDRTLRIWDLDTQRLARRPLHGHGGSVLCLQFDDSKDEDVIVSGSSDTDVILWRFSTGKIIQRINKAHKESVLNLRFDKRFLVTCSKDKTIKIWNRKDLKPSDTDYPSKGVKGGGQCPNYIIDLADIASSVRHGYGPKQEHLMQLPPYKHLMTLDLHGAAVNAIQIYKDQLVSASGDRCLRVWNIHTGECLTKIEAHQKGIACVQYDGKRIVSGSSDNTIRIWDPISHMEVARLEGHSRLVRTIQAAFADVPGGRERLPIEAAEVDRQWRAAREAGLLPEQSRKGVVTNPGSRKPKDLRNVGAKIPPSGGGGRWSHIVSGSYDETVIIWRKTEEDEWVIGHRLRQEEALAAAGPMLPSRSEQIQADRLIQHNHAAAYPAPLPTTENIYQAHNNNPVHLDDTRASVPAQQIPQAQPSARETLMNVWQHAVTQHNVPQPPGGMAQQHPPNTAHPNINIFAHPLPPAANIIPANHAHPPGQPLNVVPQAQGPTYNYANANAADAPGAQPNARVFKLQFDARRIICCSQDPKIVGWDFANGDEQIMEASRFFSAPQ